MTTDTVSARRTLTHATGRNLGLTYVAYLVLATIGSTAYHHWSHGDNSLRSDIPFYVVAGLIAVAVAGLGVVRARTSRHLATAARVAIGIAAFGIVIWPIAYYTPFPFVFGVTAHLLGRDAGPGRLGAWARALGLVSAGLGVLIVVLRVCGVTYQVGG